MSHAAVLGHRTMSGPRSPSGEKSPSAGVGAEAETGTAVNGSNAMTDEDAYDVQINVLLQVNESGSVETNLAVDLCPYDEGPADARIKQLLATCKR